MPIKGGALGNNYTEAMDQPYGAVSKYIGDGLPGKMTRDQQITSGKMALRNKAVGLNKRTGDWICPRCQDSNWATRNLCKTCNSPKPT